MLVKTIFQTPILRPSRRHFLFQYSLSRLVLRDGRAQGSEPKEGQGAKKVLGRVRPEILTYIEGLELGRRRTRRLPKAERKVGTFDERKYVQVGRALLPKEDAANALATRAAKFFSLPFLCRYSAGSLESIPPPIENVPEIAVLGRSNVGKSSLLNAISGTRLVRTSSRPGKTRTLSWFSLGVRKDAGADISKLKAFLVDVPGLGFAYASKGQREQWQATLRHYLATRPRSILRRVLVLLDARHAMMPHERDMLRLLEELRVPYQLVLTKADLVPPIELARRLEDLAHSLSQRGFGHAVREIHAVSQRSPRALHALRCALYTLLTAEIPSDTTTTPSTLSNSPTLVKESLKASAASTTTTKQSDGKKERPSVLATGQPRGHVKPKRAAMNERLKSKKEKSSTRLKPSVTPTKRSPLKKAKKVTKAEDL